LISNDDVNAATILTLWQDQESLQASEKGVFSSAITKVQDFLETPPQFKNFKVFSTELFMRSEFEASFY
jgi:hypothetical protein